MQQSLFPIYDYVNQMKSLEMKEHHSPLELKQAIMRIMKNAAIRTVEIQISPKDSPLHPYYKVIMPGAHFIVRYFVDEKMKATVIDVNYQESGCGVRGSML